MERKIVGGIALAALLGAAQHASTTPPSWLRSPPQKNSVVAPVVNEYLTTWLQSLVEEAAGRYGIKGTLENTTQEFALWQYNNQNRVPSLAHVRDEIQTYLTKEFSSREHNLSAPIKNALREPKIEVRLGLEDIAATITFPHAEESSAAPASIQTACIIPLGAIVEEARLLVTSASCIPGTYDATAIAQSRFNAQVSSLKGREGFLYTIEDKKLRLRGLPYTVFFAAEFSEQK